MRVEGTVDDVQRDIEVGEFVEDPRELRHRVLELLRRELLTARHFGGGTLMAAEDQPVR